VLELAPDVSNDELRRQYKKLVVENHPDSAVARGLPEEFIELANQRLAVINAAYEEIKQERGL
jgi:DnaJ like chaperone protein